MLSEECNNPAFISVYDLKFDTTLWNILYLLTWTAYLKYHFTFALKLLSRKPGCIEVTTIHIFITNSLADTYLHR